MAAKHPARNRGRHPLGRTLSIPVLALTALLAQPASGLAGTGSVYVDSNRNVGAGEVLFNGSLTGNDNVGIGDSVMPSLTSGFNNTAAGSGA